MNFNRKILLIVACAIACRSLPILAGTEPISPPTIRPETLKSIAPGVSIIQDPRIKLVPNIGIVEGRDAILVIDTGIGPLNGRLIYNKAKDIARGRRIYLTTTHFHPEHSFGASAFQKAGFILNQRQADELRKKGPDYLSLFRSTGNVAIEALKDTVLVEPGIVYRDKKTLDLGGMRVELYEMPAHTLGDQVIYLPRSGVLFTDDLAETGFFPVLVDGDSRGAAWIFVIDQMIAKRPKLVVPGHGVLTDVTLLHTIRDFLARVQSDVAVRVARGDNQAKIIAELKPTYLGEHPEWDNGAYLPLAIATFYAEAKNLPPDLPRFDQLK